MTQLLIPTRLDAIYLAERAQVIGPISDYEILPWFDGNRDHNGQTPNLGWAINAKPFADHRAQLEPGVHLHWALPDALTRGGTQRTVVRTVQVNDLWFPQAPNRWLVQRRASEGTATDAAWLIESDYVHPQGNRPDTPCTLYPRPEPQEGVPPYLYLGRQIPLNPVTFEPSVPVAPATEANRLTSYAPALTALGPGDPYFAAHYTSCRSVFGMVDTEMANADTTLVYTVFGWYDDPAADPLGRFVADLDLHPDQARAMLAMKARDEDKIPKDGQGRLGRVDRMAALRYAVKEAFGSETTIAAGTPYCTSILCQGRTLIDRSKSSALSEPGPSRPIGIGSTASEAFAASLDVPEAVEDRVIQSLAATDLSSHGIDLGQKLREARHNEQFRGFDGHSVWMIRPKEDGQVEGHQAALTLDPELAHALNQLNMVQERYDTARDRLTAMRQALFADWTHFMRAAYPEGDEDPFGLDPNALAAHVERTRLAPLEAALDDVGELFVTELAHGDQGISDDLFRGLGVLTHVGSWIGTATGTAASTQAPTGQRLTGFRIYHDARIGGIQALGSEAPGPLMGSASATMDVVRLLTGEHFTEIEGLIDARAKVPLLGDVTLLTNFGRRLGPFGTDMPFKSQPFRMAAPHGAAITGFQGRVDDGRPNGLRLLVSPVRGLAARIAPPPGSLAAKVILQHRQVQALMKNGDVQRSDLTLGLAPGPRNWRPHDPILALHDPHARPSPRYGKAAHHPVADARRFVAHDVEGWDDAPNKVLAIATALKALTTNRQAWATNSSGENWHPLHLEWQAEFRPRHPGSNNQFDEDYITANYALADDHADLTRHGAASLDRTYSYLSGRAALNPSIGRLMMDRLDKLPSALRKQLETPDSTPSILPLGGLHDQLIMRSRDAQIPVSDPIGVPMQKDLAGRVRTALGPYHPKSPLPQAPFHPIRSGDILIQRLRLVDTFGRTKEWHPDKVRTTKRMAPDSDRQDRARLPVRLSQPARLNFRWLSAGHSGDIESNAHPATSPICGWLLANDLGGEIDVYDSKGALLGVVTHRAEWTPAPGDATAPRSPHDILDVQLRRVAEWLCHGGDHDRIGRFVHVLDESLQAIDPQDAARNQARALLLGRPVALVRARLSLCAMGDLVEEQSLDALKTRMDGRVTRATQGYEHVKVPVRLGEHGQLNDGLCGYWIEDTHGFRGDLFQTPHGVKAEESHHHIRVLSNEDLTQYPLQMSLTSAPLTVTMLMDPRGSVHATTGILPVKSIAIPEEQYNDQISNLRAVFRTGPVLMSPDDIALPLPKEPGFGWSWIAKEGADWVEVPHHPAITREQLVDGFGLKGAALWERLRDLGRIQVGLRAGQGLLMPGNPNAAPDRFDDLGLSVDDVERGLHALAIGIEQVRTAASYGDRSVARNGWLELRPDPEQPRSEEGS